MPVYVFFSWQADTPNAVGRSFLRRALEEVCRELSTENELQEAMRGDVRVDSDTQGVAGQPPIADTILKKIDNAAVVVCDMTFTAKRLDGRPSPNPNVLIEYGWALKSIGHSRVISVMNTAFGKPTKENMPFDLAHLRLPTQYEIEVDMAGDGKAEEKRRFKRALKAAIQASLAAVPSTPSETSREFQGTSAKQGPARFRASGEALGLDEDYLEGTGREVFLADGPAMWLRVMPTDDAGRSWKISELKNESSSNPNLLLPLRAAYGGYSYVRASDGSGMYPVRQDSEGKPSTITPAIAFAFRTGEIWSIDTSLMRLSEDRLVYLEIESAFVSAASKYREFLLNLGVPAPFRWEAGLVGIKGRRLAYPPSEGHFWINDLGGPICVADLIEARGTLSADGSALNALITFFEKIFEACGIDRPSYLPSE